ncbi:DUF6443 domain-containing protein [Chryseobacterium vaccae]|uniref:DUF6443 domain-containing protein n=1 Tax=Chryseobacterium vaccae TaxID=2604424 RepID=UPI001297AAD2|nr:DUF6443 domain-containing protein [Chryseobacterium vaccae]
MKKQLNLKIWSVFLLEFFGLSKAQTTAENYVQTKTCLDGDCTKKAETITYFDGLGRAKQIVNVKATPLGQDIVVPVTYDIYGRQLKDILPVPASTMNSHYHSDITNETTANSYYGSANAFSEKQLENTPLDRVLQEAKPGDAWKLSAGHTKKYLYETNTAKEVKKFITNTSINTVNGVSNTVSMVYVASNDSGNYPAGMLYKNTVIDEDGNPVTQFQNSRGQVILIRRTDGAEKVDTYYVYNEYNQQVFVIPPKAVQDIQQNGNSVTGQLLDKLCYQYSYDGQNRIVEKKLPGKGWEFMVYDKADRLVLSQDVNLRTVGQWQFTKYDEYSRPIYTGIVNNSANRQTLVNTVEALGLNIEARSSTSFSNSGTNVYYTNSNGYPTTNFKLLNVNYYDTYLPEITTIPLEILGQQVMAQELDRFNDSSTKGLLTASYLKNIEDDNWTKNYQFYDTKARNIASNTVNHLGGYTRKETKLDFSGQPLENYIYHRRTAASTEVKIKERFVYDNQNRLVKQYHQVDTRPEELLAENTYNEIGQLVNKKTGNTTGTALQSIDYTYNIQGWLTKTNDPENLDGKLFGYALKYEDPADIAHAPAKYNGNIAEFDWRSANDDVQKRYAYRFDKLDRLTDASYREPSATAPVNDGYSEYITYDLNGNIQTLKRYQPLTGTPILIDDLKYNLYEGNRLKKVIDESGNESGYTQGGTLIAYDDNGNMTDHFDKGIEKIIYNHVNLPKEVIFVENNNSLAFIYRADGVKQKKTYREINPYTGAPRTTKTDYLDGFQYEDVGFGARLLFLPTSEGYFDYQKKRYIYNYKDHLGNLRLAYYRGDNNEAIVDRETGYYPFGLEYEGFSGISTELPSYAYGFQGQEKQKETGWSSFKWRNSIPELGRFFNVDPLSEKYAYQSHYNFAENKVIAFREIEGLEGIHYTHTDQNNKTSHTIEKNFVILTQKTKDVPILSDDASKQEVKARDKIIRQNENIKLANQARVDFAKEDLNTYYAGTFKNGNEENVNFKINISELQVNDTSAKDKMVDGVPIRTLGNRLGIISDQTKEGKNLISPASIWTTAITSSVGEAQLLGPMIWRINSKNPSVGNLSHEFGHNLGLDHPNGGAVATGIMSYPPERLTSTEIDTIIMNAYQKK